MHQLILTKKRKMNWKSILTTAVVVLVIVWLTAKLDESRAKAGKKLIFNPNI